MIKWLLQKLKGNGLQVILLGSFVLIAVLLVLFRYQIFSEAQLFDSLHIGRIARGEEVALDEKYALVGGIYGFLGLGNLDVLVGLISLALMTALIFWIFRRNTRLRISSLLMAMAVLVLSGVFFSGFSKELFEIIIVCGGCLWVIDKKWGWLAMAGFICLYGMIFRPYWLVIGVLYLGWMLVFRVLRGKSAWWLLLVLVAMVIGAVVGYFVITGGDDISVVRTVINTDRFANTKINNLLPETGIVSGVINSLLVLVWFFIPWQLWSLGSLFYFMGGLLIAGIMWGFGWWIGYNGKINWKQQGVQCAIALILAFLVVSCLFEPDFRSFLRHLTPIILFMIYCLNAPIKKEQIKIS